MKRELKESFEIRVAGTEDWYSMTVPGSAMDTLVKAGVLPDPYYGENEYQVREFFRNDFDIQGHFTVSPEEFKAGHMLLVFNGIDTVADLYLNGHKLGHTENMHRRFTFDIKKYAKEGDNLLEIHLASPLNFYRVLQTRKRPRDPYVQHRHDAGQPVYQKTPLHVWLGLGSPASGCRHFP